MTDGQLSSALSERRSAAVVETSVIAVDWGGWVPRVLIYEG